MLNRRTLMKTAAAVGLSSVVPLLEQSSAAASGLGPVAPGIQAGNRVNESAQSLLAVERWENLLDDLDCIELAARYTVLTNFAGKRKNTFATTTIGFYAGCPFCLSHDDCLYLKENSYYCEVCLSQGTAIDFFMELKKCSCATAIARLQVMLDAGKLQGHRPEQQQYWRILAKTRSFYQDVLCHRAEGVRAKRWLREQGIGPSTVERFGLGYAPVESNGLLKDYLQGQGYTLEAMEAAGVTIRNDRGQIKDRYAGLLIPIADREGHLWGFFYDNGLFGLADTSAASWVQGTAIFSERRVRRLIVPAPMWPQDLAKFNEIVIATTAWEVVALHSIGIENAVCLVQSGQWLGPYAHALRTACALGKTLIYPWSAAKHPSRGLEVIMAHVGHNYHRVKLLDLPSGYSLVELLQQQGPEAVRTAISAAIPLSQVLSS